jgi:putative ABC transport system permease protein
MNAVRQDLVYALRSFARAPGFTAAAVLTLALGIGANSAIFSVVDAVLLRPLPFPGAGRVVDVAWDGSGILQRLSAIKFQYWKDNTRSFEAMATWRPIPARVEAGRDVAGVHALEVTADFLRVLGFTPALGRGFEPAEVMPGGPGVAIISHAMWRTHFGGAADTVGRAIRLNGEVVTIVGVLPESFAFPHEDDPVAVILPLRMTVDPASVAEDWPAIARLREAVTRGQAQTEVAALTASFRATHPNQASEQDRGMKVATFSELYVADVVRQALWILMGAVALVLCIACANVANLFLARASRRRGEMALRTALGATRGRIIRLVLTESMFVALAAGALGLFVGRSIASVLVALSPAEFPRMASIGVDWRVTLFTFAAALITSLIFGTSAAWPAAGSSRSQALKEQTRGNSGRSRVRQGLLVTQAALSMILLVGAGLLVATLIGLMRLDPGFDTDGIVGVRFASKPAGYDSSENLWLFEQRVLQQLEGSPVIRSIAGASSLPLERGLNTPIAIPGRQNAPSSVEWRAVTPGYFSTLGISLKAGRTFVEADNAGGRAVAIVNEAFARRYLPDVPPVGQHIDVGRSPTIRGVEIVGVVSDVREVSLRTDPRRTMYVPQSQAPDILSRIQRTMPVFVAATGQGPGDVQRVIADAVRAAEPALPRPEVFPLGDLVTRSLVRERFGATLVSMLAAAALALTAFGIYGVLTYSVQQRRREIGIRMALGAGGGQVARLVMVQGMAPVLIGMVIGIAGALALSRVAASFLWGVTPTDPGTMAAVAGTLVAVALLASWIPARQAARLDPLKTLNWE